MLCLGMHSNVMLRFIVQVLQDPPLCSSTHNTFNQKPLSFYSYSYSRVSDYVCQKIVIFLH